MDNNAIEVSNDEINVEEIMEKIRENIRRKQGELSPGSDNHPVCPDGSVSDTSAHVSIENDLAFINSNWNIINNSYFISSHRPYLGKILVKGRQLIHAEIKRYIDPTLSRQTQNNASTVRILNDLFYRTGTTEKLLTEQAEQLAEQAESMDRFREETGRGLESIERTIVEQGELADRFREETRNTLERIHRSIAEQTESSNRFQDVLEEYRKRIESLQSNQHQEAESRIAGLKALQTSFEEYVIRTDSNFREIPEKIKENVTTELNSCANHILPDIAADIKDKAWLAGVLEKRIRKGIAFPTQEIIPDSSVIVPQGMDYISFEERFRGSRERIKTQQLHFLQYFMNCSRVLDIGCGRGEFLEILKEHDIGSFGIDIDEDMVAFCRSHHLDVTQADALSFLEKMEDESLDGIFIDQVVEHLDPGYLVKMIALCYRKLTFGSYIVIETINSLSLVSFFNFYLDITHNKPIHPFTLKFLVGSVGFKEDEIQYYSPIPAEDKLRKISLNETIHEREQKIIEDYNFNVDMLNLLLWGPMDYAIIAKK
jgi:SAM-dependent methyltransferase